MDEVRIWGTARTQGEIKANMMAELANPAGEADLVAYYPMNHSTGTTITDVKGTCDLTLYNTTGTFIPGTPYNQLILWRFSATADTPGIH